MRSVVSILNGTHLTLLVAVGGVVAASLIVDVVGGVSTSLRLRRLMSALASVPDLQSALRLAVADVALTVAYEVDAVPAVGAVRVTRRGAPSPPPTALQMSTPVRVDGDGQFSYPLPWADDEQSSFVETRDTYVELLRAAGFTVRRDEDRLAAVVAAGPPEPGSLTQVDLFGPEFAVRMANNRAGALAGLLSPVLIVAVAA